MSEMDFADLESATGGSTEDDSYDLQNDFETVELDDAGDVIVGELIDRLEDIGQYDSVVYLFDTDDGKKMFFSNASVEAGWKAITDDDEDAPDADDIDMFGVQKTDRTYENDYGTFAQYEVRFQRA